MKKVFSTLTSLIFGLFILATISCNEKIKKTDNKEENKTMTKKSNPVVYFEIPVTDINRAITFYKTVFNFNFDKEIIDKNEMALFPFKEGHTGISGALAKGEIYKPTKDGVVIYFTTDNIDETIKIATANGGKILYPKTDNGLGLVAEFEDPEGNRIALYQSKNNEKKEKNNR